MLLESFNKNYASETKINDGFIKSIWLERSNKTVIDDPECITAETGENVLIEFENGKTLLFGNSEWLTIYFQFNIVDLEKSSPK